MNRYEHNIPGRSRGFATGLLGIIVLFLATAAGVAWVGMGIVASDRWPIRWLEVNGEFQRVSAEQLRASLSPHMDSNFFTVNLKAIDGTASDIPWVSTVTVQKAWPDTVTVTVAAVPSTFTWTDGAWGRSSPRSSARPASAKGRPSSSSSGPHSAHR